MRHEVPGAKVSGGSTEFRFACGKSRLFWGVKGFRLSGGMRRAAWKSVHLVMEMGSYQWGWGFG